MTVMGRCCLCGEDPTPGPSNICVAPFYRYAKASPTPLPVTDGPVHDPLTEWYFETKFENDPFSQEVTGWWSDLQFTGSEANVLCAPIRYEMGLSIEQWHEC